MTDQPVSTGPDSTPLTGLAPSRAGASSRFFVLAGDVIPFVPNLAATISTFLFTFALPWACYWLTTAVIGEEGLVGDLAAMFMTSTLREKAAISLGSALVLLVVGMILQFWQYQRPFANWWPAALAFPLAWVLLLPEFLLRQAPLFVWIVFGVAVPLVLSVHWMVVVLAREATE
jgi:hypothetical protein